MLTDSNRTSVTCFILLLNSYTKLNLSVLKMYRNKSEICKRKRKSIYFLRYCLKTRWNITDMSKYYEMKHRAKDSTMVKLRVSG